MASICRTRNLHYYHRYHKLGVRSLRSFSHQRSASSSSSRASGNGRDIPSLDSSIFISKSHNPYFNLTFEDWLFRHKNPEHPLLVIYRDDPCVIVGRNQNPWKELNFEALRARPGVPFIRRRSGGGTVYHDLGNTNFSIHLARTKFDRHATAQVVLRAVRSLGVDARVNDRNDICIGSDKICSAYKIVNKRAYHHGTMLISTQLGDLGDLLRTNKEAMITRGVASVKSPVCNLHQYNTSISHEVFAQAVVEEFSKEYDIYEEPCYVRETEALKQLEYIQKGMNELPSWDWQYGQTPEFSYTVNHSFPWADATVKITSKHGIIQSCSIGVSDLRPGKELLFDSESTTTSMMPPSASQIVDMVEQVAAGMEGKRYGFVNFGTAADIDEGQGPAVDLYAEAGLNFDQDRGADGEGNHLKTRANVDQTRVSVAQMHLVRLRSDVEKWLRHVMDMET